MSPLNALLSFISIVAFAWLGRRLALSRNRNSVAWGLAGALLPPLLVILWRLPVLPKPADETAE